MWRKQKRDNKQRSSSRSTTDSMDGHEDTNENEDMSTSTHALNHHHTGGPLLSHHLNDYTMPQPYMHHPHPSLMSHPPPPPPTLWRPQQPQYQPTHFMPPPPGY